MLGRDPWRQPLHFTSCAVTPSSPWAAYAVSAGPRSAVSGFATCQSPSRPECPDCGCCRNRFGCSSSCTRLWCARTGRPTPPSHHCSAPRLCALRRHRESHQGWWARLPDSGAHHQVQSLLQRLRAQNGVGPSGSDLPGQKRPTVSERLRRVSKPTDTAVNGAMRQTTKGLSASCRKNAWFAVRADRSMLRRRTGLC